MIVYESAPEPLVRAGELDLAGRRVAARATPYAGEIGAPRWRFDPIARRFVGRPQEGIVAAGPSDPESWRAALLRAPAGAVLVGPDDAAEPVRGAYRAAAQGAALAGRGVYLLDPAAATLPEESLSDFVALFAMLPRSPIPEALELAARRGLTAGVLFPLIPGWTAEPEELEATLEEAAQAGARFAAGVSPAEDGQARRSLVEARAAIEPDAPEDFFERIHHADWSGALARAQLSLAQACARRGIASLPPRPIGPGEPRANAAAAGHLEEKAEELSARDEHRASLLHAAARWIDEFGRDLTPILEEGNFRKIFPFGEELAREAEEAFGIGCGTPP
jgi:hypothetical protein